MGLSKKHAKGRLDKYYHMAKEQGYRARSAFKLIQLNKKYGLLENAKVLIDLCAAPGGWLQVAAKYMPKPSVIIGLDLAPIKPIPGVITFVEDITTEKCKATLKGQLKHFKADVVLHDGAPNVGTSWLQDAFTQSELVLSSLKLATHFLVPGGTFVSKVFRSKDYNKLLWVFNQLFSGVEATKPASSRNVSAEIFVVCTGYLAPKKIDPKFLDPKWVFKEVDDFDGVAPEEDEKKKKERQGALLNDLLHPEKRRRHRDGYAEGDYTLYKKNNVVDFVKGDDHVGLLSRSSSLGFDIDDEGKAMRAHPLTNDEILACCDDLKVLGKKDFKALLKWRDQIRLALGIDTVRPKEKVEAAALIEEETEESMLDKLAMEANSAEHQLKKAKKKAKERKAKLLMKLRMGMDTPKDIGIDAANAGMEFDMDDGMMGSDGALFSLNRAAKSNNPQATVSEASDDEEEEDENEDEEESDSDSSCYSSDEETRRKVTALENDLDNMYESFRQRQREKDPSAALKAEKKKLKSENRSSYKEQFEEWYGVEYEKKSRAMQSAMEGGKGSDDDDDSSANGDGGEEEDVLMTDSESESEDAKLSSRAKTFFDNPVFKSMKDYDEIAKRAPPKKKKSQNGGTFDSEVVGFSSDEDEEDDDEAIKAMNAKADRKRKRSKEEQEEEEDDEEEEGSNKVQIVPAEMDGAEDSDDNEDYVLKTAAAYSLAQKLIHPSGKRDLIDDGFSKFAFDDHELLPSWFVEDEQRHYKPNIPVTKEAVELMRTRAKEMNARPIKKVAEAKFRKRFKAMKKAEKLQQKANLIAEDDDMPEAAKAKSIVKLMAKANAKKQDKKPHLVVAKGAHRGVKGRPKGVKGKYKMMDPRMKKELRADKRAKKAAKPKRRK